MNVMLKFATINDSALVLKFIQDLAKYENLDHTLTVTEAVLNERLFGEVKYAEVILACVDEEPVGFAVFSHSFSTFLGKPGIYLENLYVIPAMRGKGVAKKIFSFLANIILERGYGRLEVAVLDWNNLAIDFYEKMGAKPINGLIIERFAGDTIEMLARL